MNFEILNVNEKPLYDTSITYAEKHTHQPYGSSSFNNNDEIRMQIQHQDAYTLPSQCSLYIEGKVSVLDPESKTYKPSPDVKFVNNGILLLFDEIRIEMAGAVIDRIRNPGLVSAMKGYATFNKNQSVGLQIAGWFPRETSTIIDETTGNFNSVVPLSLVSGFCEDYKHIILNVRQEVVLIRSNSDTNALICTNGNIKEFKVDLFKIQLKMPHISVSDAARLRLIDQVASGREIIIPFRGKDFYEYPLLPETQRHTWPIKTSIERPQFVFFGLQVNRKNKIDKNYSHFDHCNLTNIKVFLNDELYPYDNLNLNFDKNQFALLYEMYAGFQKSYLDKENEPLFTPEEFKNLTPLAIVDCTKQNESLKRSPIDIRIDFETSKNIPENTSAYCLILHERQVKYIPLQNVVRVE